MNAVLSCPPATRPLQSQLALACDRKTDAGLKESAKLFQVRWAGPGTSSAWHQLSMLATSTARAHCVMPFAPEPAFAALDCRTGVGRHVCPPA